MIKINYQKKWNDNTGTCYSQTITATRKDYLYICNYLEKKYNDIQNDIKTQGNKYDLYTKCYMRHLANTDKNQTLKYTDYFLNLTQLGFIAEIIKDKRLLIRNTVLRFLYV